MTNAKPLGDIHVDALRLHGLAAGADLIFSNSHLGRSPETEALHALLSSLVDLSRAVADDLEAADERGEVARHGGNMSNVADHNISTAAGLGPRRDEIHEADDELLKVYRQALELNDAIQRMPSTAGETIDRLIAEHHRLEAMVLDTPAQTAAGLAAKLDLVFYRGRGVDEPDGTDESKVQREVREILKARFAA